MNRASFKELVDLPGVGEMLAHRIIANRPYHRLDELKRVKGIGDKTFEKLRPLISIERSME